ncbi:MAG: EamA family transporter [Candidatus Moranbacteria bacterium]|nr:EamA family transporter [Candidatus Moranbacteria bacterium]
MWIPLALLAAFSQSFESAIKKKSLQVSGMNTVIGAVSFMVAGFAFFIIMLAQTGKPWYPDLSVRFWEGMFWYAGLNIVASWYGYKALDIAEFAFLAPFIALTSLTMVIPPIFVLGEVPSPASLIGIAFIAIGSVVMTYQRKSKEDMSESELERHRNNRKGLLFFLITAACFTFTPTATKVTVQESSPMFASFLVHTLIGVGFLVMTFVVRRTDKLISVFTDSAKRKFLLAIVVMGLLTFLENGSISTAMTMASVSTVMAMKRTAPLFSFLIGMYYFKERTEIRKKMIGTLLMVAGAVLVTAL